MLSEQLKPCPFCGAELVRLQDKEPPGVARWDHPLPEVLSYEMCMLAGHTVWVRGPNDAARWNARSSPPADLKAVLEVLEPFAKAAHLLDDGMTPDDMAGDDMSIEAAMWEDTQPKVGDLRRAAEVYDSIKEPSGRRANQNPPGVDQ